MPMQQETFIKYPFAVNGDTSAIAIDTDPSGNVSWQQGFPPLYQQNPENGGKTIGRQDFNYIMNYLSTAIYNMQINGGRLWDSNIANNGGYPLGARCMVYYNVITNQVMSSSVPGQTITIPIVSMVDNNTTNPTALNALISDWFIDDGLAVGQVKIALVPALAGSVGMTPSGYLDVGDSAIDSTTYNLSDYPRVAQAFNTTGGNAYGVFQKSGTTFTIIDIRGGFPRVWSNGSSIDSGRLFDNFQSPALPNIKGGWDGEASDGSNAAYGWRGIASSPNAGWQQIYWGAFKRGRKKLAYDLYTNSTPYESYGFQMDASLSNPIYSSDGDTDPHPFNFNIKMYVKV